MPRACGESEEGRVSVFQSALFGKEKSGARKLSVNESKEVDEEDTASGIEPISELSEPAREKDRA